MIFRRTEVAGAFILSREVIPDHRGFFARTWCQREAEEQGIEVRMVQSSVSWTRWAGTLRGLHFSWPPAEEGKLVRCSHGRVFDVIVDLRPDSPTFLRRFEIVLTRGEGNSLFVPPGVAHGFQTLEDDCEVLYMMSDYYRPETSDGVRFDDPEFAIQWPLPVTNILERDRDYPDFDPGEHGIKYRSLKDTGVRGGGDPIP